MNQLLANILERKNVSPDMLDFFINERENDEAYDEFLSFEKFFVNDLLPRGSDHKQLIFDFNP